LKQLQEVPPPAGYEASFVYLIARHGTRYPTGHRAAEITMLQDVIEARYLLPSPCMRACSATQ